MGYFFVFLSLITRVPPGSHRLQHRQCSPERASSGNSARGNQWRGDQEQAQASAARRQARATAACRWANAGTPAWAGAGERKGRSRASAVRPRTRP